MWAFVASALALLAPPALAQGPVQPSARIISFSVGPDETLTYPDTSGDPNRLLNLADEHTTFIPLGPGPDAYLAFASAKVASSSAGGAVALQTSDLQTFQFATALGYGYQLIGPPVDITKCNATYATEFDENYVGPGSVVQDPTLPPGNLIMIYEAENHCPGGTNQHSFYATIGFARSSDGGKTWPPFANSVLGNSARHPILKCVNPQPATSGYTAMGNAIPSAFVDKDASGDYYLYVIYGYHDGGLSPASDGLIRMARAKLGADPLDLQKWYQGAFSEPGIGGLDSGVLPGHGCGADAQQHMAEVTYNDDLGLYLMVYVCLSVTGGSQTGSWYYSTASSLDLQDWTAPEMIANSEFPVTSPCPGLTTGGEFDGWYPSLMSPGAAAGHTKLTGRAFFINGCDTGKRTFTSRTFTISAEPLARLRRHLERTQ
ncbi:MAG: sialidase family protein [Thermoanaerobaculales bacterium]